MTGRPINSRCSHRLALHVTLVAGSLLTGQANAGGIGGFLKDPIGTTVRAAQDVGAAVEKGVQDVGNALTKGGEDVARESGKAIENTGTAIGKGVEDVAREGGKAVENTGTAIGKAVTDIGHEAERAGPNAAGFISRDFFGPVQDIGEVAGRIGTDTWNATNRAISDTGRALEKAYSDTEEEVQRVGPHLEDTAHALGHYVENTVNGLGDGLTDAERRIRQGKFVDAVWHLSLAPVTTTEKAASAAFIESSYLRTIGQVAASTYGGPGGAAAFSAWLVYKQTGDLNLAVRVGVITGLSAAASTAAAEIPRDEAYGQLKRVIVMGAIGGAGVAAAGGDEKAVLNGFLAGGAMVVLQDTYEDMTKHALDPRASKDVAAYCTSATASGDCTPVPPGAWAKKPNGETYVDMTKVDPRVPAVGLKNSKPFISEDSILMKTISKAPGMQAGAILHDTWHMTWAPQGILQATFVPAFAIAYYGTVAPLQGQIAETAVENAIRTRKVFTEDPNQKSEIPMEFTRRAASQVEILGLQHSASTLSTSGQATQPGDGKLLPIEHGAKVGYRAASRHIFIGLIVIAVILGFMAYLARAVHIRLRSARAV